MNEVLWLPTRTIIEKFHPENPREHTEEHDLPWIRESLLDFGWLTYPSIQQNLDGSLGYLISGHGRTIGADWLSQQDDDFFTQEWNRWIKATGRDKIATKHQGRFCADYWQKTPVIPTTLDELSQKSALLRLNNTSHDGRDDPGKIAAI
ncbi:MAG: ParB N-terminal domain-containing protein, partial [Nostoc sp.]